MTLGMDGANGWSGLLKMTHDMFRCWGFMSMAIHAHARTSELTVAHGNQQEPNYQRLQRLETSASDRQPLLKLNENAVRCRYRYQEPRKPNS